MDDIAYWLTDPKESYENASTGSWIGVTEAEYLELANRISAVSKVGTTDLLYEQGNTAVSYENGTVSNDLSTIPENSFPFAFKYLSRADGINANKVKVTNGAVTTGYINLGNTCLRTIKESDSLYLKAL
jgi:hypothetical protein